MTSTLILATSMTAPVFIVWLVMILLGFVPLLGMATTIISFFIAMVAALAASDPTVFDLVALGISALAITATFIWATVMAG